MSLSHDGRAQRGVLNAQLHLSSSCEFPEVLPRCSGFCVREQEAVSE